jgi:hypothetical protein
MRRENRTGERANASPSRSTHLVVDLEAEREEVRG